MKAHFVLYFRDQRRARAFYRQVLCIEPTRELSPVGPRDWGHDAAYSLDEDGHVLAFARPRDTRA